MSARFHPSILVVLGAVSCVAPAPDVPVGRPPVTSTMAMEAAARVAAVLATRGGKRACGGPSVARLGVTRDPTDVRSDLPIRVLAVTAKQCLSCRGLGALFRRLGRADSGTSTVALVPESEDSVICDFARREKAALTILSAPDTAFADAVFTTRYLVFRLDPSFTPSGMVVGREGLDYPPGGSAGGR